MLNSLPLQLQIRQRIPPNPLRLIRDPLTLPQPLRTPIQPIRPREQLLSLLELLVRSIRVVGIAVAEEGFAVLGEGFEFAFLRVDVGFEIPEALVYFRAGGGGDVLFFYAHLTDLWDTPSCQHCSGGPSEKTCLLLTNSFASSSVRSASRIADFLGSPDSSDI